MNNWHTTGVGSLPFVDSSEAVHYAASSYTIPFYPQLVQHERYIASTLPQMLQEAVPIYILNLFANKSTILKSPMLLANIWEKEIPLHLAGLPGILEFSSAISNCKSQFFKIQLIGAKTATYLLEKLFGHNFDSALKDVIAISLKKYGEQLRSYCRSENKKAILMIDEPLSPNIQYLSSFSHENTVPGIHCCGKFDLSSIKDPMDAIYLSFDLNQHVINEAFLTKISKLKDRSGLMLGLIDTTKQTIDRNLCKTLIKQVAEQPNQSTSETQQLPVILTGGCGTGTQSIAFERGLAAVLKELIGRV
jgi:hypothetical protein